MIEILGETSVPKEPERRTLRIEDNLGIELSDGRVVDVLVNKPLLYQDLVGMSDEVGVDRVRAENLLADTTFYFGRRSYTELMKDLNIRITGMTLLDTDGNPDKNILGQYTQQRDILFINTRAILANKDRTFWEVWVHERRHLQQALRIDPVHPESVRWTLLSTTATAVAGGAVGAAVKIPGLVTRKSTRRDFLRGIGTFSTLALCVGFTAGCLSAYGMNDEYWAYDAEKELSAVRKAQNIFELRFR